jgi:hypothetical protein
MLALLQITNTVIVNHQHIMHTCHGRISESRAREQVQSGDPDLALLTVWTDHSRL